MKIIECVPNFSEGKNESTFELLKESVKSIEGAKLLSLEPDADYNRVVVTLAGDEKGILEAAISICKSASENIDMRSHKGEHPRLGAIDVVPFVPVKNVSMDDCVAISEEFGKRIANELNLPVYLYEEAAKFPTRRNLSDIRKGEYEGLKEKLLNSDWAPDFGNPEFNEKLGALVTGARFFLVAYNVNINSTDVNFSKEIAEVLRESGRPKRDADGKIVKLNGETVREIGKLKAVKGMGVKLEKYGITQVSMNLTNYQTTPIHVAYEAAKEEAKKLSVDVNGSEIVGLVPLEALLQAGNYYSEGKYSDEDSLVELAIEKLGLSTLNPFIKNEKIIDYMI
ncbi:MAG TPA: glutamate formimidoyltransferase [Ignavibacteriaceae bacterium]|nr:glutamate formimidoyltransferase [Ignavibacteriaceae bacterium]